MISYKERKSEKSLLNKTISNLIISTKLELGLNKQDVISLKEKLTKVSTNLDKETLKLIKTSEKNIQTWLKIKEKANSLIEKSELKKEKIILKGKNLISKSKFDLAKNYIKKYNNIDNFQKINILDQESKDLFKKIDFDKLNSRISKIEKKVVEEILKAASLNKNIHDELNAIIFNNLNSLQIHYDLLKSKEQKINLDLFIINQKNRELKHQI
ncbi:hypothetical protein [Spiroplasma endosymbiont of Cantharis lateralis]|uniref:hypothetical protein n=1 Tax=Spiroplasma endosymbiont of Cantharis lateralis TaxID=3066277 RepID=UPI00313D2F66